MNAITNSSPGSGGQVPDLWGKDDLSDFLEGNYRNTIASFANLRSDWDRLVEVNNVYQKVRENLNQCEEFISTFFFFRAHSSFLATTRLALAGQVSEAYMVMRGCLESALYAVYVAGDTSRQEMWLRRHDDEASQRCVRSCFTIAKLMSHVKQRDRTIAQIAKRLYDHTIDYGAHPNERSVNTQVKCGKSGSRFTFEFSYFQLGNVPHSACLLSTVRIGVCSLDLFGLVIPERYRILEIDKILGRVKRGL